MKKLVVILVIIFVAAITMTGCAAASVNGDCAAASVYEDSAELSIGVEDEKTTFQEVATDYKYAVLEADEGTGIAWEDLYVYEIQGYIRNGGGLTLILDDGTIRVEDGDEYFLCRTEADLHKLLSALDYLNEQSWA